MRNSFSQFSQGRLISWQNDKGFGFIKPDNGGKDIFLHINQMKRMQRCPQIGDVIFYKLSYKPNGMAFAVEASIPGLGASTEKNGYKSRNVQLPKILTGIPVQQLDVLARIVILVGMIFWAIESSPSSSPPLIMSIFKPGCNVKGNISFNAGNKIYHLPGMKDYASTVINSSYGEKWFCTEAEAIRNGWSKAPR